MKKNTLIYLILIAELFSCKNSNISEIDKVEAKDLNSAKNIINARTFDEMEIYSKYEYKDSFGKSVVIQNGYPKGGVKYIDPKGNECGYAVFWTRIINETDNTLDLNIDFPLHSYEISNVPGKYFKMLVSAENMTVDKFPLIFYGLTDVESFLDKNINRPTSLKRTIHAKESSGIYFLMLIMTLDATGMTRNEISLKGQELIYKISRYSTKKPISLIDEMEIKCGSINLKNLTLDK